MHSLNRPHDTLRTAGEPVSAAVPVAASASDALPPTALVEPLREWVIPRLVERHRHDPLTRSMGARWLASLAIDDDPDGLNEGIEQLQRQGIGTESIQLDWLAAAAHELGRRWDDDECTFSDVTVGLVRMQCVMRRLNQPVASGLLGTDGLATPRILLLLAPGEQHTFGLILVAEAFRRAGWDVSCGHDPVGLNPTAMLAQTAFDVVGISVGSTPRAADLQGLCASLRQASRRPGIGLMLGGPYFATMAQPADPAVWGADAIVVDAREAVAKALRLRTQALAADPAHRTVEAVR